MPIVSIGDMSQHFMSLKNSGAIKSDLARLGQELSTGKVADIATHLGGDTRKFSGISHSLNVLGAYQNVAKETAITLDQMQIALSRVDLGRAETADTLLLVSGQSQSHQIEHAAGIAKLAFGDIVNALNGQFAGRSLFGGAEVNQPPLVDAKIMLSDILATIGGATTTDAVIQAVDTWFDDPAAGFATVAYQGDVGAVPSRLIGESQKIEMDVRADDPAMRELLKASALGAIISDLATNLTVRDQGDLLQIAGIDLLAASAPTAQLGARIGSLQAAVVTGQARLESERSMLSIAQNNMENADPFETATRLEAVQTQLETHFTVTARLSQLSLVEYI